MIFDLRLCCSWPFCSSSPPVISLIQMNQTRPPNAPRSEPCANSRTVRSASAYPLHAPEMKLRRALLVPRSTKGSSPSYSGLS